MERFAAELVDNLAKHTRVHALTNRRGKKFLGLFLPYATAAACVIVKARRIDHIHLCDALLAPLGVFLKAVLRVPVTVSVHGLDLTYGNRLYQMVATKCLRRLDLVIAGSESTGRIALERIVGIEPLVRVINYGVGDSQVPTGAGSLADGLEAKVANRRVVLTVGRLIRRKGVAWFVKDVLPKLPDDVVYVVVGDGPDRSHVEQAARELGVSERLILTGTVHDVQLGNIYRLADVFVMPNVSVPDDVEGFGLVALEASLMGLPVVASGIDGIPDAVRDGQNGVQVQPEDAAGFVSAIQRVLRMPDDQRSELGRRVQDYTRAHYSWSRMAQSYLREFESLRSASCVGDRGQVTSGVQ
jgi:glycosyltransferase involved in cell wall biosynthesis